MSKIILGSSKLKSGSCNRVKSSRVLASPIIGLLVWLSVLVFVQNEVYAQQYVTKLISIFTAFEGKNLGLVYFPIPCFNKITFIFLNFFQ